MKSTEGIAILRYSRNILYSNLFLFFYEWLHPDFTNINKTLSRPIHIIVLFITLLSYTLVKISDGYFHTGSTPREQMNATSTENLHSVEKNDLHFVKSRKSLSSFFHGM